MPEQPHPPSRPRPAVPRQPPGPSHPRKPGGDSLYPSAAGRQPAAPVEREPEPARYAELHCRSNFTFLEGASHPDELVDAAAALGYAALAVTDVNTLAGVVRAHVAAKRAGLKLLVGAEVVCADAPPCVLLAEDRTGYANLAKLLTVGRRRAPKGACDLRFADVAEHAAGLTCGVILRDAAVSGGVEPRRSGAGSLTGPLREAFPGRCWGLVELSRGPEDRRSLSLQLAAAQAARLPPVAAGGVLYHEPGRRFLHDVLTATRLGRPVSELAPELRANGERHLKRRDDLLRTFHGRADLLDRTRDVADRCRFSLNELRYEYPEEIVPAGETPVGYLTRLTWAGAAKRYPPDRFPGGIPDAVKTALGHELWLIEKLRYAPYFLTVFDLVRFARGRGILCQGRGSAANSAVCYCLGVTSVDPAEHHLFFERFLSAERNEPPDIDVDFEHERREEVIQYLYRKYGRDRAGIAATVITYRPRSAIRDVGKALGLSLDRVDALAKSIGRYGEEGTGDRLRDRFREAGFDPDTRLARQLVVLVRQLLGFPRHLSQHTGGMVVTRGRLDELVPVENASMADRTVVQWDKDDLEALGLLKVDVLALGMLTAIRKCFALLDGHRLAPELNRSSTPPKAGASRCPGLILDLADVPTDDPATFRMIRRAETVGVFQIESRAQRATLPRTRPERYYDLVVEVALIRPGPIQGGMVHPYIRRRRGEEPVTYPDDRVRSVLERTLGVPIFQEQCMKLAEVAAGFTPGEADQLRRALAGWRKSGRDIGDFERRLKGGLRANGYADGFADRLFDQIKGFGEYGFPESHAASFACLVTVSCYLKCRHPAAFFAALLNSQPMGFYQPAQLVKEARRQGVVVRPICVNASDRDCTLEDPDRPGHAGGASLSGRPALRLGLRVIAGLRAPHAAAVCEARAAGGPFTSVADCARRAGLPRSAYDLLAGAGAFAALDLTRRQARWHALPDRGTAPLPDAADGAAEPADPTPALPDYSTHEGIVADYARTGLSLTGHPLAAFRPRLNGSIGDGRGVLPCRRLAGLRDDATATVAGLVLMRQRPGSAKGVTFITLEDETGEANLVLWPSVWEQFHRPARTAAALLVTGTVQRDDSRKTLHLVVAELADLRDVLRNAPHGGRLRSRDFH